MMNVSSTYSSQDYQNTIDDYFSLGFQLGIDLDEIPDRVRASMDGSVPAEMTASEWFETKDKAFQKQYLGEGRYNLYKEGKITLSDLISKSGDTLTIKELMALK